MLICSAGYARMLSNLRRGKKKKDERGEKKGEERGREKGREEEDHTVTHYK